MLFDFRSGPLRKLYATNQVTATITVPAALEKEPSGDGFYKLPLGSDAPRRMLFIPFGTAVADKTFSFIVYVWRPTLGHPTNPLLKPMWVPYPVAAFDCTLGAMTGLSGCYVDDAQFFCDTIAASTNAIGSLPSDYDLRSPADDSVGSVDISTYGGSIISAGFAIGSSQATGANLLVAPL